MDLFRCGFAGLGNTGHGLTHIVRAFGRTFSGGGAKTVHGKDLRLVGNSLRGFAAVHGDGAKHRYHVSFLQKVLCQCVQFRVAFHFSELLNHFSFLSPPVLPEALIYKLLFPKTLIQSALLPIPASNFLCAITRSIWS